MKCLVFSDTHGILPVVTEQCDLIMICGDIVPLRIQRNYEKSVDWFSDDFCEWVHDIPCDKVIFIAGNHDFFLQEISKEELDNIFSENFIQDKLVYLCDSSYRYKDYVIYGTPWIIGLRNWAFYTDEPDVKYSHIPDDCDILLSHQPPKIDTFGTVLADGLIPNDYGSDALADVIMNKSNIKYAFCGHVHSGNHNISEINREDGTSVKLTNVSVLDEDYKPAYDILSIDI